jgi:secretion/DNA translocation related CpaE-like protein
MPARPLVITADAELLDDLLRLAAAGGTEVDVAPDPAAARAQFLAAPIVMVGADLAAGCVRARLPRRPDVVMVGRTPAVAQAWDLADPLGVQHIAELPTAEPWLVDQFASATAPPARARTLTVVGGRGGAGASVLAGGLAMAAVAARLRTLLIDADPLGGGLDLLLGWERVDGLRWDALTSAGGQVDPPALLNALPKQGDLVLLSFAREQTSAIPPEAMAAVLDAAQRGRDVVIADLPRQLDDASTVALQASDRVLLVVPAEVRATAAAARIAATVSMHCDDVAVVVRGPAPGKLKARQVAQALGLPLAGSLRPESSVCEALERGEPPAGKGTGALGELCKRLITELTAGRTEAAA